MPYVKVTSSALTLSTRVLQIGQTQAGCLGRAFGPQIERLMTALQVEDEAYFHILCLD